MHNRNAYRLRNLARRYKQALDFSRQDRGDLIDLNRPAARIARRLAAMAAQQTDGWRA